MSLKKHMVAWNTAFKCTKNPNKNSHFIAAKYEKTIVTTI